MIIPEQRTRYCIMVIFNLEIEAGYAYGFVRSSTDMSIVQFDTQEEANDAPVTRMGLEDVLCVNVCEYCSGYE